MSPQDYCTQQVAPPGSALHHALRGRHSDDARRTITAVYAFGAALDEALAASLEPAVVEARLRWWAAELDRAASGRPDHPVALALSSALRAGQLELSPLQGVLQARLLEVQGFRPADAGALMAHALESGGNLARAIAGAGAPAAPGAAVAELGAFAWAVECLRDIGADCRRGHLWLPIDLMQAAGLPASALLSPAGALRTDPVDPSVGQAFDTVVRSLADTLERRLAGALTTLRQIRPADRSVIEPLLALSAIHQALLGEILRTPRDVLTGRMALTPLRMLWAAWRGPRPRNG
jgi:phytoene synthase